MNSVGGRALDELGRALEELGRALDELGRALEFNIGKLSDSHNSMI
jgi:hypothetical protein